MATSSGAAQYLWVKVKGGVGPVKIPTNSVEDVFDLLEKVKEKCPHILENVDVALLQLYESQQAKDEGKKALRVGLPISDIAVGMDDLNPLYVDFESAEKGATGRGVNYGAFSVATNVPTFKELLAKANVQRPSEKVLARIRSHFASRMVGVSVNNDADGALELYKVVKDMPESTTCRRVAEQHELYLDGFFMGNEKLINAVNKEGQLVLVKIVDEDECRAAEVAANMPNTVATTKISLRRSAEHAHRDTALVMPRYVTTVEGLPKLPEELLCKGILRVVEALKAMHVAQWVHMDIKPANIFVDVNGSWFVGDYGSMTKIGAPVRSCTDWYVPVDAEVSTKPATDFYMLLVTVACLLNAGPGMADPLKQALSDRVRIDGLKDMLKGARTEELKSLLEDLWCATSDPAVGMAACV